MQNPLYQCMHLLAVNDIPRNQKSKCLCKAAPLASGMQNKDLTWSIIWDL